MYETKIAKEVRPACECLSFFLWRSSCWTHTQAPLHFCLVATISWSFSAPSTHDSLGTQKSDRNLRMGQPLRRQHMAGLRSVLNGLLPVSLHVCETYFATSGLYSVICLQVTMHGSQNEWTQLGRIPNLLLFPLILSMQIPQLRCCPDCWRKHHHHQHQL